MPHFVIECSEGVTQIHPSSQIIKAVHDVAESTGLFRQGDIKVRIRSYSEFTVGGTEKEFIHVFAYIMEGRSIEQKKELSTKITVKLKNMFPSVPVISINVMDFEKATYTNRTMV